MQFSFHEERCLVSWREAASTCGGGGGGEGRNFCMYLFALLILLHVSFREIKDNS